MSKILLISLLTLCTSFVMAQTRVVEGTVFDAADQTPLPGVNVVVQGTTKGTATDGEGKFRFELNSTENVLVFSFIGYKTQTIDVTTQTSLTVQLDPDSETLDEVIVVGYGEQKKSDITGATANVKGEELFRQPVLTATQAMQGKVAGVQIISSGQPGTSPQIRIRGVSTALSGTTALYVVDGVLTDDISNINTADIVDMNILKDASAAAIYGSRGANGVIIITTKKGAVGDLRVSYNNNIGFRQAANLVEMASAAEYRNYVQAATGTPPAETGVSTDWYKSILRTAFQQQHNISISGGTEKATHLLNVGYLNEDGILKSNEFRRLTIRLNEEYKFGKAVRLGLQTSYGNSINQNGFGNIDIDANGAVGSAYANAYRAAPIIPDYVDGRYGNTSGYQNVGNPLLDLRNNDIRVRENRLQGSTYLEIKPVEWITLRSSIGGDMRNSLNRGYFYQFNADENTFIVSGGNQLRALSSLNVKQTQSFRWVWDNTITLTKKFGKHDFTFLAGTTAEKYTQTWFSANRSSVPADPNLWYIQVGDANTSQNDGKGDMWARNSYLGRLNYNYDGRYLLTATMRADGSSRLPGQNRWQSYPSIGLGWVLSREGFMQEQEIFDLLKFRGSYGKVGNDQIPTDAFTSTVALNKPYPFAGGLGIGGKKIEQILDTNITWETTEEYDAAVEFGLLQGRLTGEVNLYDKRVINALIAVPVSITIGDVNGVILTNVASIQNRGVEIVANWKGKAGEEFTYNIGANATFNQNRVLALNGGEAIDGGGIGAQQGFVTNSDNGNPVGAFYVLKTVGVFNDGAEVNNYRGGPNNTMIQPTAKPGDFKYQDTNGDGQIDDKDRVFAGSYQPKVYLGVNFSANYRSFDFAIALYGNLGNQVYNGKKAVRINGTDNIEKSVAYSRWTMANKSQTEPGANSGNQLASDYFVESGSFARINNVTVGYTFPKGFLQRARIQNLRVFATAQNVFTLMKYSGFTAELPGDPISSGIELTSYPTTRTVAVGLNVGF